VALEVAGSNPVFHPILLGVVFNFAGMKTRQSASKRFTYVFILICYLWIAARPAFPYIRYQIQNDYYAKVLCENKTNAASDCKGKCALRKEIRTQNETSDTNNSLPLELKSQDLTEPHISNHSFCLTTQVRLATVPKPQNQPDLFDGFAGQSIPPPRA